MNVCMYHRSDTLQYVNKLLYVRYAFISALVSTYSTRLNSLFAYTLRYSHELTHWTTGHLLLRYILTSNDQC